MLPPEEFVSWLWETSWQASLIAVLVLVVQWLAGRRLAASWRYGLWFLVIARLLLPSLPESRASLYNVAPHSLFSAVKFTDVDFEPISPETGLDLRTLSIASRILFADWTENLRFKMPSAWEILTAVWGLGAAAAALQMAAAYGMFLRRIRRGRMEPDRELLELLRAMAARLEMRAPRLIETRAVSSPAVSGLFRPVILLPAGIGERFTRDELCQVLLHELAHLRRWDLAVHWLVRALQVVYWFNPVFWFAFGRMRSDCELACDARVLGIQKRDERLAYGRTLLKVVEEFQATHGDARMVGIVECGQMTRRVRQAAGFSKTTWAATAFGLILLAGLALFTLTGAHWNADADAIDRGKISEQDFYDAITDGDVGAVRRFIQRGVNPNRRLSVDYGATPFMVAVSYDRMDVAQALKDAGADIHWRDEGGKNAAFRVGGNPRKLQALLDWGVDVKTPAKGGMTTLHEAAISGWHPGRSNALAGKAQFVSDQKQTIEMLLKEGLSIEARCYLGRYSPSGTPLALAVSWGETPETVELLLDHGAGIDDVDGSGRTALISSLMGYSRFNPGVVELLLSRGVDVNAGAENPPPGLSPRKTGMLSPLKAAITMAHSRGEGVGLKVSRDYTRELIGRGARFACDPGSDAGRMLEAASLGDLAGVRELLKNGVSPNIADGRGWTPLMSAAALGYGEITHLLIESGADANAVNANGRMAFQLAARSDRDAAHLGYLSDHATLQSRDALLESLRAAAVRGDAAKVDQLIREVNGYSFYPVRSLAGRNSTVLQSAIFAQQFECAEMLVDGGSNPNPASEGNRPPLYWAVSYGATGLAKALIDAGANLNFKTNSNETLRTMMPGIKDVKLRAILESAIANPEGDGTRF